VNVAWVTHHLTRPDDAPAEAAWQLPGKYVGGAEMADDLMIAARPDGVDVTVLPCSDWEKALDFDRIVVTGTDLLDETALRALADRSPLVWVHHEQTPSPGRALLFRRADPFVAMSAKHAEREAAWSDARPLWNHGVIDPDEVAPGEKNGKALWAAREHPQKGRIPARIWALRSGLELTEITGAPRETVLAAMATHSYFVFLPKGFDACPRTLIEAELAGCVLVTNDLAGRRDDGDIREVLERQAPTFWDWI
jgi:hypothetical protein